MRKNLYLGPIGQIVVLGLILLSLPAILAADVYLTPGEIPSTVIYAIPVMVASRLFGRGIAVAVLLTALASEVLAAFIERPHPVTAALAMLSLAVIGILSLRWAEAEKRSASLAAERLLLYERGRYRSEELELSRQRLLDFFSMVAHDLRSPLTTVMSCASMLPKWDALGTEQRERVIAATNSATKRIARLANDLVDASRIGAGRFEVSKTRWDMVEMVRSIVDQQQATAPKHRLMVEAKDERIEGLWDEERIAQALSNLFDNAIKYSPEGGEVRVVIERTGNHVKLVISDQGVGIAPEDIPLLFQLYSRLHRTPGIKGLGLGLYITKGIVEAHRGIIEVRSEPGKGSTFTINLPLEDPP